MIKRKELQKKSLAAVMAASMTMSLLPGTVLADSTSGVLADGVYDTTAHVTRNEEEDSDDEWAEYDVNVKLTVADGKFSDITVTPGNGYTSDDKSYFDKAVSKSKGLKTKLEGQNATIENLESWDLVSGATRTSTAVKTAALAAAAKAVAPTPASVDTAALEQAIADASALKEADYTAASWKAMQSALNDASAALSAKESQSAVDAAKDALNAAVKALEKAPVATPTATPTPSTTPGTTPGAGTETGYKYVYAGLTWAEYWAAENVYQAGNAASSDEIDTKGEHDKGAFDTVTRATTNHGLHRGSFQCNATVYMKDGTTYDVSYYTGATTAVLTNGQTVSYDKNNIDHYVVKGLKYVPVKVAAADYDDFCKKYAVVENGGTLAGGFSEGNLSSYTATANVTENTNGLKTAVKDANGNFTFSAAKAGNDSGIAGTSLKSAPSAEDAGFTVKEANGSFGEFLRVDLTKNYGDLGANMQSVTWTYYGNDATYSNALRTFGTKFAADNWMHKSMGIQLGLTDSIRCQLPEGTDGTGYWAVTIHALGYADATYRFQATDANIVKADPVKDTSALEAAIAKAEALKETDYTADSWANVKTELSEAKEELEAKHTQAAVDEAAEHLNAAINALVKKEVTYKYVYAGLTWAEYWAAEGVQAAGSDASSEVLDSHDEHDKGAFDTVTRATTNHGLHRGSFQCAATIYMKDGTTYDVSYYTGATTAVLTNGETVTYDKKDIDHYVVKGLKYVPVRIAADDYEDFCKKYAVVENGGTLAGGFSESKLQNYTDLKADVTADTNGLKTAVKNADGTFTFSARTTGTGSGIAGAAQKTAPDAETVGLTVKEANGSYGEFLRVDLNGDYGDLAANLQTVTWTYYGNDSSYTDAKAVYGTKFASDNWMHKSMGIQLGLTDSLRCTLPEGTDGTGYWKITLHALGYADASYTFAAAKNNIVGADPVQSTKELEDAIAKAEGLNKDLYTETSWNNMQTELSEAKDELDKKRSQASVDEAVQHLTAAIDALQSQYVLMNIPYAAFYQAEVKNDVPVDAFTSATLNKTRTPSLSGGSYHVNADGSDITGITFPVKVTEGMDLSKYTKVTDADSVEITVTNRGKTTTTTYTGKDALYEKASYSYYNLTEVPSYYKEASVDAEGNVTFGAVKGADAVKLDQVTTELSTSSSYGDYQLDLDGLDDTIKAGEDTVYGVVVSTKEGNDYGMRHLENIWRVSELAWSTGFTKSVHGCPTSSAHYESMMGQTISKITYYTSKGIFEIPADVYVPVKFANELSVENASVKAGNTSVKLEGLPEDYAAVYSVDGLTGTVSGDTLYFKNAKKGAYTLKVSDKNGKYADLTADFILYTEEMPAAYNADGKAPALVKASDAADADFADYLKNITSVTVNGKVYSASGRGAVVLVNEDGTLKTDAAPFAEGDSFEITVSALGFQDLSFTWKKENAGEEPTPAPTETPTVTPTETPTVTPTETPTTTPTETPTTTPTAQPTKTPAANPTTAPKTTSTPLASNGVSGTSSTTKKSSNAKTGDVTNIWGWVSMAVASIGAGGLGLKLRGKKKKDDEE